MTIALPVRIKTMVPGYRAKWRKQCRAMIDEIAKLWPRLRCGEEGGTPWIEVDGEVRLYGFATEAANREIHHILRADLPPDLPATHFRLVKDCLTRFVYPHLRPDLKPAPYPTEGLFGFHGQHKDAIADLPDPVARARLTAAFLPKVDDVIVDCGCFLGFGELRLAPDLPRGHMYAIEADRKCHALLMRNLAANGAENVTPIHRAAWNEATEMALETSFAQGNSLIAEVHKGSATETVRTITVDGLVAEHGVTKLDMLSLTVNGAEVETLDGATEALATLRPRIRLAGWYSRGERKIWQITKQQLEAYDYDVYVGHRGNLMALPKELS